MSIYIKPQLRGIAKFPFLTDGDSDLILRGIVLNPLNSQECQFFADGGLLISKTTFLAVGHFDDLRLEYPQAKIIEYVPQKTILVPLFADIHLHWVQNRIKGNFGDLELLSWLQNHIFPEEARFADEDFAHQMAKQFFRELVRNGTGIAAIFSSVHESALEIALEHGLGYIVIGNVLMDQESPPELKQNRDEAIAISRRLAKKWASSYAITPRFSLACTERLLREAGEVARQNSIWIQTHLAENLTEITKVDKLFPNHADYTDTYEQAGLLTPRTILGHCIHLSNSELQRIKASGAAIAHCPTSNKELKSGRMPIEQIRDYEIPFALASDIGAGPHLCMLDVMQAFLHVHEGHALISPTEALYRATLAGTEILGLAKSCGNFVVGKTANLVVLEISDLASLENVDDLIRQMVSGEREKLVERIRQTIIAGRLIFEA